MRLPECAGSEEEAADTTPAVAVHGAVPDSKPGLPSFWPGLAQEPAPPIVQVNDVELLEPPDVAVAVTVEAPAADGVPEISPVEPLMLSPAGSPVAVHV